MSFYNLQEVTMDSNDIRDKMKQPLATKRGTGIPKVRKPLDVPKTDAEKFTTEAFLKGQEMVKARAPITLKAKAREALEEHGLDPIVELIKSYDRYSNLLNIELMKEQSSAMKMAALITAQQKCLTELLRYGYARERENIIEGADGEEYQALVINVNKPEAPQGRILKAVSNG